MTYISKNIELPPRESYVTTATGKTIDRDRLITNTVREQPDDPKRYDGAWLRQVRKEAGITQPDLAKYAGLSSSCISRCEDGVSGWLRPSTVEKIERGIKLYKAGKKVPQKVEPKTAGEMDPARILEIVQSVQSKIVGEIPESMTDAAKVNYMSGVYAAVGAILTAFNCVSER